MAKKYVQWHRMKSTGEEIPFEEFYDTLEEAVKTTEGWLAAWYFMEEEDEYFIEEIDDVFAGPAEFILFDQEHKDRSRKIVVESVPELYKRTDPKGYQRTVDDVKAEMERFEKRNDESRERKLKYMLDPALKGKERQAMWLKEELSQQKALWNKGYSPYEAGVLYGLDIALRCLKDYEDVYEKLLESPDWMEHLANERFLEDRSLLKEKQEKLHAVIDWDSELLEKVSCLAEKESMSLQKRDSVFFSLFLKRMTWALEQYSEIKKELETDES